MRRRKHLRCLLPLGKPEDSIVGETRAPDMWSLRDAKIIDSWHKNAAPWTNAVRNGEVESRRLVTNAAIVDAVVRRAPSTVLDIGCGEGWLARALAARGMLVTGVDAIPELIAHARGAGGANFHVASYEELAAGALDAQFDAAVANFSLIGKEPVDNLIRAAPRVLTPQGVMIIQTLHPLIATGEDPYIDGWRPGSWDGFSDAFTDPAPWYFRTISTWVKLLVSSGLDAVELCEPTHPSTGKPLSIIFVAEPSSRAGNQRREVVQKMSASEGR